MHKISTLPIIKYSVKYPWIVIILSLLITLLFILPLNRLQIEPDVESLLPESLTSNTDNYDKLLIMVSGDKLFTLDGLQQIQTTNKELQQILPVKQIIDPFSFKTLEKTGSRLMAVPLAPENVAPETNENLKIFINRLGNTRFASGIVSSKDKKSLVTIFLIDKSEDYKKTMASINEALMSLRNKFNVVVTGTIPFSAETEMFLTDGFSKLLILVLITILISYYLGFRSKRAVFLPMIIVISGTVVSLGMMVLLGYKLTMVSILSPPLVLTLGSSYSIHVMSAYYSLSRTSKESKKDTIIKSTTGVSGTVLLASFTTLIGLLSLLMATIRQTREFAITTSFGILFTALLSITLLPAFLAIQRSPEKKKLKELNRDILSKFLRNFGSRIVSWKFQAYGILFLIVVAFFILLPKISFNTSPTKYFPKSSNVISDHSEFLQKVGSFEELKIEFTSTEDNFFLHPDILSEIYNIEQMLSKIPNISYTFSFPAYLNFAGKVMTGKEGYFRSRGLNLLVSRLFRTANTDETMLNDTNTKLSIIIKSFNKKKKTPIDENDTIALVNDIRNVMLNNIDKDIEWNLTGTSLNFLKLSQQMRRDFLVSTITALILILIVSSISFKSIIKGILALIPLLTGIFSSLILMAIFHIPLDMTTIMVSCISIGVGVDDSIHFLLQYQKQIALSPSNPGGAIYETLLHAGRPIAITTLSIVAGLLFLGLAQFQPIRYFGLLIVFTLSTAFFATLFILPPILKSLQRAK